MVKQPSNDSGGEERNKPVANIGLFRLICNVNLKITFGTVLASKGKMKIHGQYGNRSLPMLSGHEKVNKGVFAKRFEK